MRAACKSGVHCRTCRDEERGRAFRQRLQIGRCPRGIDIGARVPVAAAVAIESDAVIDGYMAQTRELLARADLTPCRRKHLEAKLAHYATMKQGGAE